MQDVTSVKYLERMLKIAKRQQANKGILDSIQWQLRNAQMRSGGNVSKHA